MLWKKISEEKKDVSSSSSGGILNGNERSKGINNMCACVWSTCWCWWWWLNMLCRSTDTDTDTQGQDQSIHHLFLVIIWWSSEKKNNMYSTSKRKYIPTKHSDLLVHISCTWTNIVPSTFPYCSNCRRDRASLDSSIGRYLQQWLFEWLHDQCKSPTPPILEILGRWQCLYKWWLE